MRPSQRILLLCYRVARGYGVDAVVLEHARGLRARGHEVHVVCVELGEPQADISIQTLIPEFAVLQKFLEALRPTHVIAHTEPWMSLLARQTSRTYAAYVWEHGDPTPELIVSQKAVRQQEKDHKLHEVYPRVDRVFAISEFIRSDISWPAAQVVYNGLESPLPPPKTFEVPFVARPLRVGTLMRLGAQEAQYKGAEVYLGLVKHLRLRAVPIEFFVMGKGTDKDAEVYREQGVSVHLNATELEKIEYLRSLDVFVSPSLWEGFNLPLIEAQTLGVPSLAFDTGAHPEVCPLIFSSVVEMAGYLACVAREPQLLEGPASRARPFVEARFSYVRALDALEAAFSGKIYTLQTRKRVSRRQLFVLGAREAIRNKGFFGFGMWYLKKIARKILKRV
jgi:glycosyltransferase involved in cell wall biosynthesis